MKAISHEEWEKREETGRDIQRRLNRLRIKHRTVAETIGVNLAHFHQMLIGMRPIWKHQSKIEMIVNEYEQAEKRIAEKLSN